MWPITIFADEADSSAAGQAAFIKSQALDAWDVRNVNGRNVLDLTEADIEEIRSLNVPVQCIGSPVNKVKLDWSVHEQELQKLRTACEMAEKLNSKRIRLFTPESDSWEDVRKWMQPMAELGEKHDLILLIENDSHFFGATPANAQRLFIEFGNRHFKAAFDFANTVLIGYRPMRDWFPWIVPHLDTLHVKDAKEGEHKMLPAGEGDAQILETLRFLASKNWQGTLTLEPHLQAAGAFGGFSGVDLCRTAHESLKSLLAQL